MAKSISVIAAFLVAASGATAANSQRPDKIAAANDSIASAACALPDGWADVDKRHSRFIVFGEIHGTKESPAFVSRVACALAAQKQNVLVAMELPSTDNDNLQAAWRLPQTRFVDALRKIGWAGRTDGVASKAMFDLLVQLHGLHDRGHAIAIVAFSGARDEAQRAKFRDLPSQGPHEAAQAENIRDAANARPYDRVIVLVGNLHARKQPVERGGIAFKPMAMQHAPAQAIVSLNMQTAGGSMWNCILKPGIVATPGKPLQDDAFDCGSHPDRVKVDLHKTPFISLATFPGSAADPNYDGFFWLGGVSASPPAVPAH